MYVWTSQDLGYTDNSKQQCFMATVRQSVGFNSCDNPCGTAWTSPKKVDWFSHIHGSPVVWEETLGSKYRIYVQGENDFLRAFEYQNGQFVTGGNPLSCASNSTAAPVQIGVDVAPESTMPGGSLALSSDHQQSPILWVSVPKTDETDGNDCEAEGAYGGNSPAGTPCIRSGVLRAYDASDLSKKLFDSEESAKTFPGDDLGNRLYVKYVPPMIANGKVYMAGIGRVAVFGLTQ